MYQIFCHFLKLLFIDFQLNSIFRQYNFEGLNSLIFKETCSVVQNMVCFDQHRYM